MKLLPYDSIIIEALEELAPNNFHYIDSLLLIPTHGTDWILHLPIYPYCVLDLGLGHGYDLEIQLN